MQVVRIGTKAQHDTTPLFVRASLPKTFLGLGVFVEIGLLFCGLYLLMDALESPLEANQSGVIASATILALAIVLMFYLFRPLRKRALAEDREPRSAEPPLETSPLTTYGRSLQTRMEAAHALRHKHNLPGPM